MHLSDKYVCMKLSEFLTGEHGRIAKRATIHNAGQCQRGSWLGGTARTPKEAVEGGPSVLERSCQLGDIRDFRIFPFGGDLHIQINTLGKGLHYPEAHKLAYQAATAAPARAAEFGFYQPVDGQDFFKLTVRERLTALGLRPVELPFTERGAEPIVIAKLINGAVGARIRFSSPTI